MINVGEWQQSMQRRINRGCHRILSEGAERVELHHLIFVFHAAISISQCVKLVQIKSREAFAGNASKIASAALDPEHRLPAAIKRITFLNFGTGISAAKIRDPQV